MTDRQLKKVTKGRKQKKTLTCFLNFRFRNSGEKYGPTALQLLKNN